MFYNYLQDFESGIQLTYIATKLTIATLDSKIAAYKRLSTILQTNPNTIIKINNECPIKR